MGDEKSWLWVLHVQNGPEQKGQYLLSALSPGIVFKKGVPREAILGELAGNGEQISPEGFRPNPVFIRFLHWVIASHATQCPELMEEAKKQRDGFVYIIDQRTKAPGGQVPQEDIIGAFEVKGGALETYRASPNYQLLTDQGPLRLVPWYQAKLLEELRKLI